MTQKNFLFLSIDDLNDWTGGLGGYSGTVHTPNLDSLMDQGTTFTNAFSQAAICNASRTSALTGLEPQHTGVFKNQHHYWEERVNPADTIFGVFNAEGYNSQGVGKLFHTGASEAGNEVMFDDYAFMGVPDSGVETDGKPVGVDTSGVKPADAVRAEHVADVLTNYDEEADGPLLMSVGLEKPHFAWVVEQKYFDLYPIDEIQIDYVPNDIDDIPQYVLDVVGQDFPWNADDVGSELAWKQLIQAYLATISFMDDQVGVILDALDASDIADNTAVVLWSDHGYHLGDKDSWHKFTLWDNAARAPLIIRDPGVVPAGLEIDDPVELLDIFPTMLDMAGISDEGMALDGKSLVPYFEGSAPEGEPAAFTWMFGNVSIRTTDYRYSLYEDGSEELYHIAQDPELTHNLAGDAGLADVQAALRSDLYDKFHLVGYGDTAVNLFGTDENNVLADTDGGVATGGAGDDVYFVTQGTRVVELADGGRDMIVTRADTYVLPEFVEDVEVKDFSISVTGNELDNTIVAISHQINALGGDDVVLAGSLDSTIDGGAGHDLIKAESGNDTVFGRDGNDSLEGGRGEDALYGGIGDDIIAAGFGDDIAEGQEGSDTLIGADGNDVLSGGTQEDYLLGQTGDDTLLGQAGFDTLDGGVGHDHLEGGDQADRLSGGTGRDMLLGGNGLDRLYGGFGSDTLEGGEGRDFLYGGQDHDLLTGGTGQDQLFGERGSDTLLGQDGNDTLDGGGSNDRLDGGASDDQLIGGGGDDVLLGGDGADHLRGDAGQDTLNGGDGADLLEGGDGRDSLSGGVGSDQLFGQSGQDTLLGQGGFDTLNGGDGDDRLEGGNQADNLLGDGGDDILYGQFGFDRLFGGDGNDTGYGGIGSDALFGDQGADQLWGERDNDRLFGGGGNDALFGGHGHDNLSGGAGFDRLYGAHGNDTLTGNFNADHFIFADHAGGFGFDVITDFAATNRFERIDLSAVSEISNFLDLTSNHMAQVGDDVVITASQTSTITLLGVSLSDLDWTDFTF